MVKLKQMKFVPVTFAGLALGLGLSFGIVAQQAPPAVAPRNSNREYLRGPSTKELIYVTLPGTLEGSPDANGNGIVVLDARNHYNFVKRIPTWDVPAARNPEQVAGVTAIPFVNCRRDNPMLNSPVQGLMRR